MAITRAQQAKQMLQNGGRIGLKFGKGPGQASREARESRDNRERGMGMGGKQRSAPARDTGGRDPMAQFSPEAAATAREMRSATMGAGDRFVPDFLPTAKGIANIFQVSKPTPFDIQRRGFIQALGPRPFDAQGFGSGQSDSQGIVGIPTWMRLGFSSEAEYLASLEDEEDKKEDEGLRLAFRAEGGPIGGEYDFESARQMYGLGKLVKKVTRTVKKIAKSPIGKAALLYAGGSYLTGANNFFGGLKGAGIFSKAKLFGTPALTGSGRDFFMGMGGKSAATKGILGKLGLTAGGGSLMPTALGGIAAASALAGLLTPAQEEEAQELARGEGIDIEAARRSILNAGTAQDFRARRFVAEGGSMKEPVAKKTMPLLDMGGKEMDLREEGGFVPIGRMEKADDVPARLSKNEFVFTADAVRNAGDGDVDKGAEVMYNMMKNLEAGGDVSEESQGLEGARKMFQTSQRLEEVL